MKRLLLNLSLDLWGLKESLTHTLVPYVFDINWLMECVNLPV